MLVLDQVREALVATDEEAVIAKEAAETLRSVALAGVDVRLRVGEPPGVIVPLPARAVEMIVAVLTAMAERQPISLIPHTAELTTQQAAGFLNMSRPHLVKLFENKQIPHRIVGIHRRIRLSDLQAFKEASNKTQRERAGKPVGGSFSEGCLPLRPGKINAPATRVSNPAALSAPR